MVVERVRSVVNPAKRAKRKRSVRPRRKSVVNPAHMLTLGFLNPERRKMPAKARRKSATRRRATTVARRTNSHRKAHRRRSNPTKIVMISPRRNKGRSHRPKSRRNPHFFGQMASPMKLAEYIAGGLIGVTINRALIPMLPASITSNSIFAVGAAVVIALAEWWAFSFVSKDFGSAVGFGGLMNAGSTALNTFLPQVGSPTVPGLGRLGDLVPSQPGLPFWPSSQNMGPGGSQQYLGGTSAYPRAYGMAA